MRLKFYITLLVLGINHQLISQTCNTPEAPGLTCSSAPVLCNLDGYCSTTPSSNPGGDPGPFCGFIENAHWLKFVAGSSNISIEVSPSNCINGLQGQIFFTTNCQQYTSVSNCFNQNGIADFTLNATGLTIGETYTILIDGKGGDVCDYEFSVLSGMTQVPAFAEAGDNAFLCPAEAIVLDGSGSMMNANFVYDWTTTNGMITDDANTLNPTVNAEGTYFLTVTDTLANCSHTDSVFIELANQPIVAIAPPEVLNCLTNAQVTIDGTGSTTFPEDAIIWEDANGNTIAEGVLIVTVENPGTYTLLITNPVANCTDQLSVEVLADLETPVALIAPADALNCVTPALQLNAAGSSQGMNFQYQWTTDEGNFLSGENSLSPTVNAPGTYTLLVENTTNGCESTATITVTENTAVPTGIELTANAPCFGDTLGDVFINQVIGGNPPYSYMLNGGAFTASTDFLALAVGTYDLLVQDAIGCTWDTSFTLAALPEIILDIGDNVELFLGDSINLSAQTNRTLEQLSQISWSPSIGISCDSCLDVVLKPLESTIYNLSLVDVDGCSITEKLAVFVDETPRIYLPNVFSPNNDGINDWFYPQGGNDIQEVLTFRIYTRWGNLVFENTNFQANEPLEGWDGFYRGERLDPQVMAVRGTFLMIDGRVESYNGTLTVLR